MRKVGLRIDVDTLKGTQIGVPNLVALLKQYEIKATFFFSVGPDNMGRHLWRMLRPAFFHKMLKSNAASLYGLDILIAGTAWPGKVIGEHAADIFKQIAQTEHEIGFHAWDHHAWQINFTAWRCKTLLEQISLGVKSLQQLVGRTITCSAVAGWRADLRVVQAKEAFSFQYNSDCRGFYPFRPILANGALGTVQIPVSLPTLDEVIGREVSLSNFNRYLLDKIHSFPIEHVPVYTIHAEVEGISQIEIFKTLLRHAKNEGIDFCPLIELLPNDISLIPSGRIVEKPLNGREGLVAWQTV